MVLLVIDAQIWLTNKDLYCYERFVNGTKKVIEAARENNIEVIYVQHDDGPGTGFSKDDAEFEINQEYINKSGIEFVDLPVEAEPEEPKKQEKKQPLLKRIGKYLLEVFKKLKNKIWR